MNRFWTYVGHFLEKCWSCSGYVLDMLLGMFWRYFGHVLDMCWGIIGTCLGYVGTCWDMPDSLVTPKLSKKTPKLSPNRLNTFSEKPNWARAGMILRLHFHRPSHGTTDTGGLSTVGTDRCRPTQPNTCMYKYICD